MGFRSKLCFKYSTTHENILWNRLVERLSSEWASEQDTAFLIGNYMAEGREIDALFIKPDAIVVIDFKDYGGVLTVSENEPWTASGNVINASRKNPFIQLSDNKYAVLNLLKKKLPVGYENWVNIGHINALVLFHDDIEYDRSKLKSDLSPSASRWFNVCDFGHVSQTLGEITSRETSIKGERAEILLDALSLPDLSSSWSEDAIADDPVETVIETSQETTSTEALSAAKDFSEVTESFSDIYYGKAKSLETIKLLIVGQDPYPTNPNGVAFCKNSYYELYQEECSGGIVLKALGIGKEQARSISYKNPKGLFYELLTSCGICFINVFNTPFDQLSVEQVRSEAEKTRDFNMPLVQKAKTVVLLGKGKTKSTFEEFYQPHKYDHVLIHPSPKAKKDNEAEWMEAWETDSLSNLIV